MILNQIGIFAAVAKHVSITRASEEFRVSQPWVSQQLKQLEDHYATKLHRRVGRGVEITEAGRHFLRNITPILEQVAKLDIKFKPAATKTVKEVLRVGGSFSASAALLPSLLARFHKRHPAADLELRTGTSEQLERLVLSAVLELAVTVRAAPSADLASEALRRERVAMFVPATHALAKRKRLQLSDVLADPLTIRGGRGSDGVTDEALTQLGAERMEIKT